jgi:hypothetical protein
LGDSTAEVKSTAAWNTTVSAGTGTTAKIDDTGLLGSAIASRREFKTNIEDMGDTGWVHDLRPVRFEAKDSLGLIQYGLIAEEVVGVAPDLALYQFEQEEVEDDYERAEGEMLFIRHGKKYRATRGELLSVNYDRLIPILLNEVQKLNKRLGELEKKAA